MKMSTIIANRIRYFLKKNDITQYKLGIITAISHNTIQDILSARYIGMNTKNLFLIIRALGLSIVEFFDDPSFDFEKIIIE